MNAKDIIAPKIKAECRIDEHGVYGSKLNNGKRSIE